MLYRRKRESGITIDLSPLIDVVFLLLIFFMVSTRFKDDQGMELNLPKSESRQTSEVEQMTILVDRNGQIRLDGETVEMDALQTLIQTNLAKYDQKMVVLKVDESVTHGMVVAVMDAAKSAGATGITYGTSAKANNP